MGDSGALVCHGQSRGFTARLHGVHGVLVPERPGADLIAVARPEA
jgi:hypothetical protein